jgi:hypothetical protein
MRKASPRRKSPATNKSQKRNSYQELLHVGHLALDYGRRLLESGRRADHSDPWLAAHQPEPAACYTQPGLHLDQLADGMEKLQPADTKGKFKSTIPVLRRLKALVLQARRSDLNTGAGQEFCAIGKELAELVGAREWLPHLDENSPVTQEEAESNVILYFGEALYKIGSTSPKTLEFTEDTVLQAFLERPNMQTEMLKNTSGITKAPEVLRNLAKKYDGIFAPAIDLPGKKGRGGYTVRIRKV